MRTLQCLFLIILLLPGCGNEEERLVKQAEKIHSEIVTVDTHCDTPMDMARSGFDLGVRHDEGCVDFPRMKEGGLDAEFFAVFIGQGPRNDSTYDNVNENVIRIFETIHKNVDKNSGMAEIATTSR